MWLWLNATDMDSAANPTPGAAPPQTPANPQDTPLDTDAHRRRARKTEHKPSRNTMLLAAKTDSLTSWSELVRLDRGTDDDPDPQRRHGRQRHGYSVTGPVSCVF